LFLPVAFCKEYVSFLELVCYPCLPKLLLAVLMHVSRRGNESVQPATYRLRRKMYSKSISNNFLDLCCTHSRVCTIGAAVFVHSPYSFLARCCLSVWFPLCFVLEPLLFSSLTFFFYGNLMFLDLFYSNPKEQLGWQDTNAYSRNINTRAGKH
jgi:hypothetical protein